MSGHSKWSKIKHQKATTDIRKGRVFSELARMITLAAQAGKSGDPNDNPRLRLALEKAREANLPKENMQRAIDRGLGKGTSGTFSEVIIEGYGPAGVAIMVIAVTDNANRTKSELRQIFQRHRGATGEPGSVAYVFAGSADRKTANYTIPVTGGDAITIGNLLAALDEHDDVQEVRHNAQL